MCTSHTAEQSLAFAMTPIAPNSGMALMVLRVRILLLSAVQFESGTPTTGSCFLVPSSQCHFESYGGASRWWPWLAGTGPEGTDSEQDLIG